MVLNVSLSTSSINDAIKAVKNMEKRIDKFMKKLAEIGLDEATVSFAAADYSGENDVVVDVIKTDKGYIVEAKGEAVAFIEFGAGVYYNSPDPYPQRPNGVSGIGEYGDGKGKRAAWGYYDDGGNLVITRGTPAAMPMYNAMQEIKRIAKEVWENG